MLMSENLDYFVISPLKDMTHLLSSFLVFTKFLFLVMYAYAFCFKINVLFFFFCIYYDTLPQYMAGIDILYYLIFVLYTLSVICLT